MNARNWAYSACAALSLLVTIQGVARAERVDMIFDPALQISIVDDIVNVDLLVSADGLSSQTMGTVDAILDWDPAFLELQGFTNVNAGYSWFLEGFLPDPDSINVNLLDGDALYSALASPGGPAAVAPAAPGSLIVTTFQFKALAETPGTVVSMTPNLGTFGETRVLEFNQPNQTLTGDTSSTATIQIVPEPTSGLLLAMAGLAAIRRRRRRNG